jgi:AcrR family transcriptional regulator
MRGAGRDSRGGQTPLAGQSEDYLDVAIIIRYVTNDIYQSLWQECVGMKNTSELKEHNTHQDILSVAERLFGQVGFQKTTIADIARELRMSSAKVYRFFSTKAEINEAVARRLLSEAEAAVGDILNDPGPASEKLRASAAAIEKLNAQRFASNRKLHELLETAFNANWSVVHEHVQNLDESLTEIIAQGDRDGEFHVEDCELAAVLVRSACMRFFHPWLTVNCAQEPEPTVDQMVDFCSPHSSAASPRLDATTDIGRH